MTTTVAETTAQLAGVIPLDRAAAWDPVGLQFGDPDSVVTTIAVCHEVTPRVAEEIIARDVDLVVAYHPLLFHATTRLVAGPSSTGLAHRLITNGVALVIVHTAFDIATGGTADSLAAALELEETQGFGPNWTKETSKVVTFAPQAYADAIVTAMAEAGAGQIGGYSNCSYRSEGIGSFYPDTNAAPVVGRIGVLNREPELRVEMIVPSSRIDSVVAALVGAHPYEQPAYDVVPTRSNAGFIGRVGHLAHEMPTAGFADFVGAVLGGVMRVAGEGTVSSVAVVPGSGGSLLSGVVADAIVTGDVSHHQARDAVARGMTVVDPGHAATERPGVAALYAAVAQSFDTTIDMTRLDADPWKER